MQKIIRVVYVTLMEGQTLQKVLVLKSINNKNNLQIVIQSFMVMSIKEMGFLVQIIIGGSNKRMLSEKVKHGARPALLNSNADNIRQALLPELKNDLQIYNIL